MRHVLKLEFIGQNHHAMKRALTYDQLNARLARVPIRKMCEFYEQTAKKPWVAEIVGLDAKYTFARKFLSGKTDYSGANSIGSRGVYLYFILEEDKIYDIQDRRTWKRTERYFLRITNGQHSRLTDQEVIACLLTR